MNFGLFMSIFILLAARWRLITNYPGAVLTACLLTLVRSMCNHTNVLSREIREAKFETSLPEDMDVARAQRNPDTKNWVQGERRTSQGGRDSDSDSQCSQASASRMVNGRANGRWWDVEVRGGGWWCVSGRAN